MAAHLELKDVKACVFDAYGTLLDVAAAAMQCQDVLGDKSTPLAPLWRTKQIEYTWLRSLMGDYKDFWHVTGEALDYAMDSLKVTSPELRARLMALYFALDAFPEVAETLKKLRGAGIKTAILSNANRPMLYSACLSAGLVDLFDHIFSVDDIGIYKVHPSAYQLAIDGLYLEKDQICFMSSNAWDQAGAAHFGFKVVRINRYGALPENLPGKAVTSIPDLSGLPHILGLNV